MIVDVVLLERNTDGETIAFASNTNRGDAGPSAVTVADVVSVVVDDDADAVAVRSPVPPCSVGSPAPLGVPSLCSFLICLDANFNALR